MGHDDSKAIVSDGTDIVAPEELPSLEKMRLVRDRGEHGGDWGTHEDVDNMN